MMQLIGQAILVLALVCGTLSAATAYLTALDLRDERLLGLTLASSAGAIDGPDGSRRAVAERGEQLTANTLSLLRAQEVYYAHVEEFSWDRWRGRWAFVASVVGLLVSAVLLRGGVRRQAALAVEGSHASAAELVGGLRRSVAELRREVGKLPNDQARMRAILQGGDQIELSEVTALVGARDALVRELGRGGYAELMGSFSLADRSLHRAWSAAADGELDESVACLERAAEVLDEMNTDAPTGRSRTGDRAPAAPAKPRDAPSQKPSSGRG